MPNHTEAFVAAVAAQCANDQGKFWEYHDQLFANQTALSVEALEQYAVEIGLELARFNECLNTNEYEADVRKDIEDAQTYGVTGTPAFFVNGRFLSGNQSYETFREVIDDELQRSDLR